MPICFIENLLFYELGCSSLISLHNNCISRSLIFPLIHYSVNKGKNKGVPAELATEVKERMKLTSQQTWS